MLITGSRHGFGIDLWRDPAYSLRGISFDDGREFWRHDTVLTDSNSRDCDASAFIAGQAGTQARDAVRSLAARPDLDADLRLKLLEFNDALERTVRIRERFAS